MAPRLFLYLLAVLGLPYLGYTIGFGSPQDYETAGPPRAVAWAGLGFLAAIVLIAVCEIAVVFSRPAPPRSPADAVGHDDPDRPPEEHP